jgi:Tol biopolymer transport system component
LERIVRACLAKDPDERWQSAADMKRELAWVHEAGEKSEIPSARRVPKWERWAWGGAVFLLLAALAVALLPRRAREAPQIRFDIPVPSQTTLTSLAVSPDGRRIVCAATGVDGRSQLWMRSLDADEFVLIPATEEARFPFWSADSRYIAFFAQGKLKKMEPSVGVPINVCDAPNGRGGAWNADDMILFSPEGWSALFRVPASGGVPVQITALDDPTCSHRFPQFLSDGNNFLFYALNNPDPSKTGIYTASLRSGTKRRVMDATTEAYGLPGHLITVQEGTLIARGFDESSQTPRGPSIPLAKIARSFSVDGRGAFSSSKNGVLVCQNPILVKSQLSWVDRSGAQIELIGPPGVYEGPALSLKGDRLALAIENADSGIADIWIWDLSGGSRARLTTGLGSASPAWSPSGENLIFVSGRDIFQQAATGGEKKSLYYEIGNGIIGHPRYSADGRSIIFDKWVPTGNIIDLYALRLVGDLNPYPLVEERGNQIKGQISPNGKWLVYESNESGKSEVYVQGIGEQRGKYDISPSGGSSPRWSSDGRELYFISPEGRLMAVAVQAVETWKSGPPAPLFELRTESGAIADYLPAPDGRRFLLSAPLPEASPPSIKVVVNWTAGLKK